MQVLSKEEFLRRYLRDQRKRREMKKRKEESEIIAYYAARNRSSDMIYM